MSTLTIRLPESTADRLKSLARRRGLSVSKLIEELSTQALAIDGTESRFRAMAGKGNTKAALKILDRLDRLDSSSQR